MTPELERLLDEGLKNLDQSKTTGQLSRNFSLKSARALTALYIAPQLQVRVEKLAQSAMKAGWLPPNVPSMKRMSTHLERHITKLVTVMELSESPRDFDNKFQRVFHGAYQELLGFEDAKRASPEQEGTK